MRPASLFDRDREWADLAKLARAGGPQLGIVYGRRRQGKSFLLRALCEQLGGFYHQALEEERESALASLGTALGDGAPLALASWDQAMRALVARHAPLIVLDELPFLVAKAPELPSVIQRVFDEARSARARGFRLLLCGSAISVMSGLLSGARPLRGRASLQLRVEPFDFRTAASFWRIADRETAFLVDSIVGGTPGYRDLLANAAPSRPGELADWLADGILDPSHALFSEAEHLLTEDPSISDRALYQSVLAAITRGAHTQREIGGRLGRDDQAMQHPLLVLERGGFIRRDADALLAKRPAIRVADPMLRFHHAIVRPDLARFESRRTREAWTAASSRFESQVLGPHFEQLARDWTARFASSETLGGTAVRVGSTQVNDPQQRERFEIDVVAVGEPRRGRPHVLAVGEAKGGATRRDLADLGQLERRRELLAPRASVEGTRLLLFSRSGFSKELVATSRRRDDVELVDLARLYAGE